MKTVTQPAVITPSFLLLALLFSAVLFIGATGKKIPLLSNVRVDIILLVIIGMAMCMPGIGRVAALGQWAHPLSILAVVLGGAILLVGTAVFVGWKLPFVQNDQQALIVIAVLTGLKVVTAITHYLLSRA